LEDEARKLGKDISSNPPELLVVVGNLASKMAKEYCGNCPVLYASASNASLLKLSGEKVFGISAIPSPPKVIENIRLVFPEAKRLGLIYNPNSLGREANQLQASATKANLVFKAEPITEMKEIPNALNRIITQIDLLVMLDDPSLITDDTFPFIFMNCFQKKIPIFATSLNIVKKGALAGYALSASQIGTELASFANDILTQKIPATKEKILPAKLFLNSKVAQMWNFSFTEQAVSHGLIIQ
jgi:putative ABC transport system substrate-binding protein